MSRAAALKGIERVCVLYGDFWNLIKALLDTLDVSYKLQSRAPAAWLDIFEVETFEA